MQAVQLKGTKQVCEAYNNSEVKIWAIFQGKSLLTKGEGEDMLQSFLELLTNNSSTSIYTLKLFEDYDEPKQVKEKSEASTSLNFRLTGEDFDNAGVGGYRSLEYNRLEKQIEDLKKQLSEPADEPQTLEQAAIGLISNPAQLAEVILAAKEFASLFFKSNTTASNDRSSYAYRGEAAAVGHLPANDENMANNTDENLVKRLQAAINILEEKDPKLVDHLERLAIMAQDNPTQFKMLLGMLEKF